MSTSVPFDLGAAADATDLSIQKFWLKSPADTTQYYPKYYYVEPVKDYYTKDSSITSISAFSYIPENGAIPASSPYQGFDKTFQQAFFGGMLRVTRPMWRYGVQVRKLQSMVEELRKDANRFKDTVLANPINNMTSTSYTETAGLRSFTHTNTGGDGVAPNSTAHTREDAGTNWNNQITDGTTVNLDFDYAGWKAALTTAQAIKGGVGEILDVNPDILLCKKNSAVHFKAQELLVSLRKGEQPDTANRDGVINNVFSIVANPYFTTAAYWGMMDSSMKNAMFGLQMKEGMPLQMDDQNVDYDTKEIKYSVQADFAYGFNDLRSIVLSTGANA